MHEQLAGRSADPPEKGGGRERKEVQGQRERVDRDFTEGGWGEETKKIAGR